MYRCDCGSFAEGQHLLLVMTKHPTAHNAPQIHTQNQTTHALCLTPTQNSSLLPSLQPVVLSRSLPTLSEPYLEPYVVHPNVLHPTIPIAVLRGCVVKIVVMRGCVTKGYKTVHSDRMCQEGCVII